MRVVVGRDVNNLTHGLLSEADFESIVVWHFESIEERISSLSEEVPESEQKTRIMIEFATVARCKLPRRLELVGLLR